MDIVDTSEFPPRTADKVERLLDILEEMGRHPDLRGKLAMYGGTAINLFTLNIPRLSVDIDVSYIGAVGREEMLAERPTIEQAIEEVASALGYIVETVEGGHAGRTFLLRYRGGWGTDHVKIDCIYMNRSPLIQPTLRECPMRPGVGVLMFDDLELAGGKIKAFFDRVKVRDLYDIANLSKQFSKLNNDETAHQVALYYASLSARFPLPFSGRSQRFADRQNEFEDQLLPMLRSSDNKPTLEGLMEEAEEFVERYILPRTDTEQEYLDRFAQGDYQPPLLLTDPVMAEAASKNPEALWKLQNLKKMQANKQGDEVGEAFYNIDDLMSDLHS